MNFFADESLDRQIIARLRQDGHAVLDVTEMGCLSLPCAIDGVTSGADFTGD